MHSQNSPLSPSKLKTAKMIFDPIVGLNEDLQPDWNMNVHELEYVDCTQYLVLEAPEDIQSLYEKNGQHSLAYFYSKSYDPTPEVYLPPRVEYEDIAKEFSTQADLRSATALVEGLNPLLVEYLQSCFTPHSNEMAEQFRQCLLNAFHDISAPSPSIRKVFLSKVKDELRLVNDEGRVLALGTYFEIVEYVSKYYPHELRNILQDVTKFSKRVLGKSYKDFVLSSRVFRRMSPIMDKMSKISQFTSAERDHPVFRYNETDYEDSQPRFAVNEKEIISLGVRVDSFLTRDEFLKGEMSRDGSVFYVNCVVGDHNGSVGNDMQLLDKAIELSKNNNVQVLMHFDEATMPDGFVISKPRPHNAVVVWEIDRDIGGPFQKAREKLEEEAIKANEKRNLRFFLPTKVHLLESVGSYTLTRVFRNHIARTPAVKMPDSGRAVKKRYKTNRRLEMERLGRDATFSFERDKPHVVYSSFTLFSHILHANDPGTLQPDTAMRSLGLKAIEEGNKLVYRHGQWTILFR